MNSGRKPRATRKAKGPAPQAISGTRTFVFVSHAASDEYVARKLADDISGTGAESFVDAVDVQAGDEIATRIRDGLAKCSELVVLLTPASKDRRWVWMEIGGAWLHDKRVVGIVQGMTVADLLAEPDLPIVIRQTSLVDINEVEQYLRQLRARVRRARSKSERR
jgi:hypothetical protein